MTEIISPSTGSSHRRLNILTGEWVLVSPHRAQRPWQGQVETVLQRREPAYDPACYLCPGNTRAGGERNPAYSSIFVFDNDYPALRPHSVKEQVPQSELIVSQPEPGICRVGCFSPRHDLTLAGMNQKEIVAVIEMWRQQFADLGGRDFINYVQIFENRGAMMGASNSHPHCQIWGTNSRPNEPAKEQTSQLNYLQSHQQCLLCEYLRVETSCGDRLIFENEHFVVLVPFWAVWPFETLILPRQHMADLSRLTLEQSEQLADVLQKLTSCYDRLFDTPFPYSMGFHQQPTDGPLHDEWHLHAHFFPPLLRSASIRKFMVGFELLGTPQRDITPEFAAERLRNLCNNI
ncbi:MAG: UDP-glucose--hexose-1-phosphate uridylyltransferase [Candidatus Sulfotelmatobacter sp.]